MDNTKHLGSLTELQCITYLFGLGYDISIPYGDNSSYDFILDVNGKEVPEGRQMRPYGEIE